MNNRFKFRVWDDGHGESKKGFWWSNDMVEFWTWIRNNHIPESNIQQYTGLNDKKGKEIYEGDFLRCIGNGNFFQEELFGRVEFQDFEYCIVTNNPKWPIASFKILTEKEIIGNIFENPELLK